MWEFTKYNEFIHTGCEPNRDGYITSLCDDGEWHCLSCFIKPPEALQFVAEWKKCRCADHSILAEMMTHRCTQRVIEELTGVPR